MIDENNPVVKDIREANDTESVDSIQDINCYDLALGGLITAIVLVSLVVPICVHYGIL